MRLICLFLIFSSSQVFAERQKTLGELKTDISKIDRSIEITRQKMKEVRDVTFLPDLYFVLAELYVDKSRYWATLVRQENPKLPINELDFTESRKSKKQAIEIYTRIIENFPKTDNVDKALFFMAHEYRELGSTEDMVKTYIRLTTEFPKSPYWEESQLTLGDYFLEQKKDPLMALEVYQKILTRPQNPFIPTARYKTGWCYINQNKFYEALLAFEGVLTVDAKVSLEKLPDMYKKSDTKRDALMALVWPYSEQKKYESFRADPLKYFESLSPNRQALLKVLDRLTKRLMLKNRIEETVPIYFRLISLTNNLELRIEYFERFYDVLRKSKKEWPLQFLPSEVASTLIRARRSLDIKQKEKTKVETNFEIYLRDFATKLQQRAKQKNTVDDYQNAIRSYQEYLWLYPNAKAATALMLNLAESYFVLKKFSRAGYFYEKLSLNAKLTKNRKDVMDSAVQSYAMALKDSAKNSKLEMAEARNGFRAIGRLFVKTYPTDLANPMILFNIGRTYYDERIFDKAVKSFSDFINLYPTHKETPTAGNLILDSFNQRDDYDGLIKAGRTLISNNRITDKQFKADVTEIIKQAEYRKIQNIPNDPRNREYAKKLLGFAQKYKGSSIGDQALYEAFISLKAKKDPEAYTVGEQLLNSFSDSKYAQDVVGNMGQMAINTADYRRAAQYFEIFSKKYPKDPNSKGLLKNAASLRELLGDTQAAAENYRELGDYLNVAKQYALAQDWTKTAQTLSARPSGSLEGQYLMGLSLYRNGQFEQAKPYLTNAAKHSASSFEEKKMAAHSVYLLATQALKNYQAIRLGGGGNETELVKVKNAKLNDLTNQFNTVIRFGNGRWTIAALYQLGRAHSDFSQFVMGASMPAGLSAAQQAQYKQLISQQAGGFQQKAKAFYTSCIQNAEKYEVFTRFVKGCQSQGVEEVDEAAEERVLTREGSASSSSQVLALRKKLYDNPRNIPLLMDLGQAYLQAQDYSLARVIYSRVLELKPNYALAEAELGQTLMFMNDLEASQQLFKTALTHNRKEALALWGLYGLYKEYGFNTKARSIFNLVKASGRPSGVTHPWMK